MHNVKTGLSTYLCKPWPLSFLRITLVLASPSMAALDLQVSVSPKPSSHGGTWIEGAHWGHHHHPHCPNYHQFHHQTLFTWNYRDRENHCNGQNGEKSSITSSISSLSISISITSISSLSIQSKIENRHYISVIWFVVSLCFEVKWFEGCVSTFLACANSANQRGSKCQNYPLVNSALC